MRGAPGLRPARAGAAFEIAPDSGPASAGCSCHGVYIGPDIDTVKILLDGRGTPLYQYLYDVKINRGSDRCLTRWRPRPTGPIWRRYRWNATRRISRSSANCRANSTARSIATAPIRSSKRRARTGSSATACCTPSTSKTAAPAIATAGSAPRNGRPSTTPAAHCSAASAAASCPTRRPRHAPTPASPIPTSSFMADGCWRWRKAICRPRSSPARSIAWATATMARASPVPSPPIPRSIPSPARWCSSATTRRGR